MVFVCPPIIVEPCCCWHIIAWDWLSVWLAVRTSHIYSERTIVWGLTPQSVIWPRKLMSLLGPPFECAARRTSQIVLCFCLKLVSMCVNSGASGMTLGKAKFSFSLWPAWGYPVEAAKLFTISLPITDLEAYRRGHYENWGRIPPVQDLGKNYTRSRESWGMTSPANYL